MTREAIPLFIKMFLPVFLEAPMLFLSLAVRARCPQTSAFSCYGGHRTCQNSSSTGVEVQWIECYHGPDCGIPCDGVPECEDESDEKDLNVCPSG